MDPSMLRKPTIYYAAMVIMRMIVNGSGTLALRSNYDVLPENFR